MHTNYLSHLANIIDIQWSISLRVGGGGNSQLNWLTCCKRQESVVNYEVADKHDAVLEVIDGQAYYSKFLFSAKIIPTISNFYIYHKHDISHIL